MRTRLASILFSFAALALVSGISWLAGLAFTGYLSAQPLSRIWLFFSDSGNIAGVVCFTLSVAFVVALFKKKIAHIILTFFTVALPVLLFLWGLAFCNENFMKPLFSYPRPYVLKLDEMGLLNSEMFYSGNPSKEARSKYLTTLFRKRTDEVKGIHPAIRGHWVEETGFSFPSGHSLAAFTLHGFLIYFLLAGTRGRWRLLTIAPFVVMTLISVSRIAVGAHSPLDVTVGAAFGWLIASILILTGLPALALRFGKNS